MCTAGWLEVSLNDLLKKEAMPLNDRPGRRSKNSALRYEKQLIDRKGRRKGRIK
jgi:hypothetical protein